ncbi:hypothetical protein [Paenibacillus nasutitermitis]|uniref:Uncharacterized protein n=1 Tax=Paenibacillus nasutitermitis TaxID=1652958 RepID=A0A917DVA3_9BACL|nr:hypothetical protein [Paenibacillus nasutitermitis]GGD72033.1 hypothetical protein GCM10010911_32430 [Paenibacillus nasutitermitis]
MKNPKRQHVGIRIAFLFIFTLVSMLPGTGGTNKTYAAGSTSAYLQLAGDTAVNSATTLLTKTINFSATTTLLIQSDGRYYPSGGGAIAGVRIKVDSAYPGSDAIMDWSVSTNRQQHSYNAIAAVTVPSGSHTISLEARSLNGVGFTVGARSNLSILATPAASVSASSLTSDSGVFNFSTGTGYIPGTTVLPHSSLLSCSVTNASGPVIALGSARAYMSGGSGDAMLGIYRSGTALPNNEGMWTVNDLWSGAENQAPLYTHALINTVGTYTLSLDASEFPWSGAQGEDGVQYKVGAGSTLICLNGGMTVAGSAPTSTSSNNAVDWLNIGTGTDYQISGSTLTVPSGHNGTVMFMAKTRIQCDQTDLGGTVKLWLNIDGVDVGSLGVQQLASPNGDSQRTLTASYLAAGSGALSPGTHNVKVYARADGSFLHPSVVKDLQLIWFD